VAKLYPAPPSRRDPSKNIPKSPTIGKDPVHSPYEPAQTPGARTRDASGKKIEAPPPAPAEAPKAPAPTGGGGGGSAPSPPPPPAAEGQLGRLSGKGLRPWER
jgi:hypothetical protein